MWLDNAELCKCECKITFVCVISTVRFLSDQRWLDTSRLVYGTNEICLFTFAARLVILLADLLTY